MLLGRFTWLKLWDRNVVDHDDLYNDNSDHYNANIVLDFGYPKIIDGIVSDLWVFLLFAFSLLSTGPVRSSEHFIPRVPAPLRWPSLPLSNIPSTFHPFLPFFLSFSALLSPPLLTLYIYNFYNVCDIFISLPILSSDVSHSLSIFSSLTHIC